MARRWTIIKSYTRRRNVWLHVTLSTCARSIVKRIPGRAWVTINHDSSLNFALNRSLYSNFSNWILKKFPSKKKITPVLKGSYKYTPCNYYLKYKILAQVTIDKLSFPKNVHIPYSSQPTRYKHAEKLATSLTFMGATRGDNSGNGARCRECREANSAFRIRNSLSRSTWIFPRTGLPGIWVCAPINSLFAVDVSRPRWISIGITNPLPPPTSGEGGNSVTRSNPNPICFRNRRISRR